MENEHKVFSSMKNQDKFIRHRYLTYMYESECVDIHIAL